MEISSRADGAGYLRSRQCISQVIDLMEVSGAFPQYEAHPPRGQLGWVRLAGAVADPQLALPCSHERCSTAGCGSRYGACRRASAKAIRCPKVALISVS